MQVILKDPRDQRSSRHWCILCHRARAGGREQREAQRETGSRKGGILGLWIGTAVLLGATAVDGDLFLVDAAKKTLGPICAFAGGTANRSPGLFRRPHGA